MIDITMGGMIGAMIGTVIAALAYGSIASTIERALAARSPPASPQNQRSSSDTAALRRGVLAFDILLFAGLGYWIGDKLVG